MYGCTCGPVKCSAAAHDAFSSESCTLPRRSVPSAYMQIYANRVRYSNPRA